MEPSPEAAAWAKRADAWAQRQPEGDQSGQVERTRWSEVATGRPAFPADGVGWRTETAEWRATEQTARWRQTTEWRSSSGSHGWRSTTEAWQTGDGAEGFRPPVDPQTRQQLAISGSAWPTPQGDEQPVEGTSTWQQPADSPQNGTASWQQFTDPAAPATESRPAWQQFAAPPALWEQAAPGNSAPWQPSASAPWEQDPAASAKPWQDTPVSAKPWQDTPASAKPWQDPPASAKPWQDPPASAKPWQDPPASAKPWQDPPAGAKPWQRDAAPNTRPWEQAPGSPSWQQLVEPTPPTWAAGSTPAGETTAPGRPAWDNPNPGTAQRSTGRRQTWQSLAGDSGADGAGAPSGGDAVPDGTSRYTETRSGPFDDGRHLVREDDRAQWRREARDDGQRPAGRRRAAEPGSRTSGGTGWSTRAESDNWAGHADTGSMEFQDDPGSTNAPSWGSRSAAPSWGADRDEPAGDWRTRGDSRRAELDSGSWSRGEEPKPRRNPDDRQQIGWQPALDDRAEERDLPRRRQSSRQPAATERDETPRRRQSGRRPIAADRDDWDEQDETPSRRPGGRRAVEPDGPSWQRSAPAAIGWQPSADEPDDTDGPSWRQDPRWQEEREEPGWRTGVRRRNAEPADPWAQGSVDTGIIPFTGQQPSTDTDSWRSTGAIDRTRPMNPNRRRDETGETSSRLGRERRPDEIVTRAGRRRAETDDDVRPASAAPVDPEIWRREPGSRSDDVDWPEEDPQDDWSRDPQPETPQDNWRRDLAADSAAQMGEAATEIRRPARDTWQREEREERADTWQREERATAERGSARYRGEDTGDWRQAMAAETSTNLGDGESSRAGTQGFVPFRPVGSASVPKPASTRPVSSAGPRPVSSAGPRPVSSAGPRPVSSAGPRPVSSAGPAGPRKELLVGVGVGAREQGTQDMEWPPRQPTGYQSAQTGSYERRPVGGGLDTAPSRQDNLLEPDEDEIEENTGGPLAAVGYTVIWYGVPVVLFVLYMLVLNGSQQAQALSTLAGAAPQFGLSLILSMVVAVGLRLASGSWKSASVGLAAAVMGGGLATVLSSAITGNSLS